MRILMLTQWFQPEPHFKGMPFAKALRDLGHEVEVLTGFPNYPGGEVYDGYRIRPYKREMMDGITIHRVALFPSHDNSGMRRILNYLSFAAFATILGTRKVAKPDVVYVYNLVTLGAAAQRLRRHFNCPVVLDVQDLWPESVASSGMLRSRLALKAVTRWTDRVYRSADQLVVLSPGFKRNLVERGVPEDRIEVIYNWCDEASIGTPERDDGLARRLGMEGRFNVVFAGTMGVLQSLDCVLMAARMLADNHPLVQFVFVGGGVDVPRLKLKANSLGLRNVLFVPRMPPSEISKVLALADALLVHLRDEPLFRITIPSKTQAYLAAGRPILMGVAGDAADLVAAAAAGIPFDPGIPSSLFAAVAELAKLSPLCRANMGRRGSEFYHRELAIGVGVEKFAHLFVLIAQRCCGKYITEESTP